jgi:hypothetical protein
VRLETLEGVVAYLSGELEGAEKALGTAHRKWKALQARDHGIAGWWASSYMSHALHLHMVMYRVEFMVACLLLAGV